jgi:hypothetical protein
LANSQSLSPADTATPTNPHRRPSAHRLPAGSFFGGFRTPARRPYTGSTARARPPSETLPQQRSLAPSTATAAYAPFRPLPHADAEVSGGVIMKTSRRAATSWLTGAMPKIRGDRLSGADAGRPCSRCSEDRHRSSCCVVDHGRNYAMRRSTRPADRAFVR